MKLQKIITLATLAALIAIPGLSYAKSDNMGNPGIMQNDQERPVPPPHAFEACKDKQEGDEVEISVPDGHKVKGSCVKSPKGLFARPEHPPRLHNKEE